MIHLETNRLVIRKFQLDDAPALRQAVLRYSASEYAKYDHPWPTSEEEIRGVAGWFAGGENFLAVCLKESGQFIGFIALNKTGDPSANEYDLGYVFDAGYYGHGYATEGCKAILHHAFSVLHADRVTGNTALKNGPSCRLLARLGMRKIREGAASFQ